MAGMMGKMIKGVIHPYIDYIMGICCGSRYGFRLYYGQEQGVLTVYGFDQKTLIWYCMFVTCGIWCLADVLSVGPSSEHQSAPTKG